MLGAVDRIQIATTNASEAPKGWETLLGAKRVREDGVRCLNARRVTYRLGRSMIEFLEPIGAGPIDEALRRRGRAHLFAAGASSHDLDSLKSHLERSGVDCQEEGNQIHALAPDIGGGEFRFVLSPPSDHEPAGDVDFLYEVTLLGPDSKAMETDIARIFGLDANSFCPIKSGTFHYEGSLTLFDRDRLHRFEAITPHEADTTMRRFLDRQGPAYYMTFAETASMTLIEERAREAGAAITVDRPDGRGPDQTPDQMWIHPPALGGVMLGLSRPTMAWKWSGHPERVEGVS